MKQVCIIHGGTTFETNKDYLADLDAKELKYDRLLYAPDWKSWLGTKLRGFDVLLPKMPNNANAQYDEWALYFSKIVPLLRNDVVLVGHSLGSIFLAKYLQENKLPIRIKKLILIAAPYNDESAESLGSFKLSSAKKLSGTASEIHLMHSEDDPVVLPIELDKYITDLPEAAVHRFKSRQHFNTPTFPELLKLIKK